MGICPSNRCRAAKDFHSTGFEPGVHAVAVELYATGKTATVSSVSGVSSFVILCRQLGCSPERRRGPA
jgi:hypothetical protein